MRLSARNYDKMSIIHFPDVARKEFRFVRGNLIPDNLRDLYTDFPQKSRRYDVANSRYHFRRREIGETIKFASSSTSKKR